MKIPVVDDFLNNITMYRLTLYVLIGLVGIAVGLSYFGILSYNPLDILIETGAAVICCYIGNTILAKFFNAVTSIESVFITALILVLIVPVKFPHNLPFFILVSGMAMAAKYLPTIDKRHIFNPAAAAVAAVAMLSPEHIATWWIGTPWMMPFVLSGGVLIVRKIRREHMVITFLTVFLLTAGAFSVLHNGSLVAALTTWKQSIFSSALLFFTFIMLTEPLTSPAIESNRSQYAILVAFLYATPQMRLFNFELTPELALLVGNVFSYIVSPKYRLALQLKEKIIAAKDTVIFNFGKVEKFTFAPGQYMEWTLPHKHVDSRGNRRYFSLASTPQEDIQIAVRFYNPSSSYKKALANMQVGDKIIAASLEGSFVLPKDLSEPLVFVAGGVGIVPFRSMLTYIYEKNLKVNIVLLYANRQIEEIAYVDILTKVQANGVRTIYTLTDAAHTPVNWQGETGYFTSDKIQQYIPDFDRRLFYISGPQPMVQSMQGTLEKLGVKGKSIRTDYFPGYEEF